MKTLLSRTYIVGMLSGCLVGFAVNQAAGQGYPVPAPEYELREEHSVLVPMRDGVKLSTDLYVPADLDEKLPVLLIRTPYNQKSQRVVDRARWFAGHGYVVAVQDVRGKFESQGNYIVSAADTDDGFDTIDWVAMQAWSTGNVGTY